MPYKSNEERTVVGINASRGVILWKKDCVSAVAPLLKATCCKLRAISVSGYAPGTQSFFSRQEFQSVQPFGDIVRITTCTGEFGELQGMVRQTRL